MVLRRCRTLRAQASTCRLAIRATHRRSLLPAINASCPAPRASPAQRPRWDSIRPFSPPSFPVCGSGLQFRNSNTGCRKPGTEFRKPRTACWSSGTDRRRPGARVRRSGAEFRKPATEFRNSNPEGWNSKLGFRGSRTGFRDLFPDAGTTVRGGGRGGRNAWPRAACAQGPAEGPKTAGWEIAGCLGNHRQAMSRKIGDNAAGNWPLPAGSGASLVPTPRERGILRVSTVDTFHSFAWWADGLDRCPAVSGRQWAGPAIRPTESDLRRLHRWRRIMYPVPMAIF
jgi:hypothetical protein